jgi:predicted patatin/cPLA2 family phospholipase
MKTKMILEGGGMRGMYTCGVLDVLMDNNIEVDSITGVSAGALFGANYFSKQRGRAITYNKLFCNDKRYMSFRSLILTGNYVNKKFAYYKVSKDLVPFDNKTFMKSGKEFIAVVTNIETGKPEYIRIKDGMKQMEVFRATSAMPLVTRVVKIDGKKYLDGGISDSIPIDYQYGEFDKTIVVLTQHDGYKKKPLSKMKKRLVKWKFRKYKELVDVMINRYNDYNETLDRIRELEKKGEIFVIRPSRKVRIKMNEKNPNKYQAIYDIGVKDAKKAMKKLKKYLED